MVLFVDMDEVIADACMEQIERYNREFNESLKMEHCLGREIWQSVPEGRQANILKYAHTVGFFKALTPIKDSQEVLEALSKKYEIYIASAAMEFPNSLYEKSNWLDEYFPFIHWKNRILCGAKHILKGDILIDDRSYNLDAFQGRTLLFTSPHNIHESGHERVGNWQEVAKKLL